MHDCGCRMPTQNPDGRSRCLRGETIDIAGVRPTFTVRTGSSASLRHLGADLWDKERILKFVRHHHPPFPVGGESAIQALQDLTSRDRGLPPCSMFVRQFLALVILYGAVVVDVEKIPRHPDKCMNPLVVPWHLSRPGQSTTAFAAGFRKGHCADGAPPCLLGVNALIFG